MSGFKVGDIVARKSYNGDVYFKIADIINKNDGKRVYVLKGMLHRIEADSFEEDLLRQSPVRVYSDMQRSMAAAGITRYSRGFYRPVRLLKRVRTGTPGRILHVDSSEEFLNMCLQYYRQENLKSTGRIISESDQPGRIYGLLESTGADVLIITGHDGIKKDAGKLNSLDSYRNSKYFIQSVREARRYQPSLDKLCIFAGACQSYYEGIMGAGANFASSPGRILIQALDPAKVGDMVALTDSRNTVTAEQIAEVTESGSKGIGGIRTKGHFISVQ